MYNRTRTRRRTGISFVISLFLHLVAVLVVSINFPRWYQLLPPPEPIVAEPIEVKLYSQLLHPTDVKKPISHVNAQIQRHEKRAPSTPRVPPKTSVEQVGQVNQPVRLTANPPSMTAQLPPTPDVLLAAAFTDDWRLQDSIGEPLETIVESPQSLNLEIERDFSQKQETEEQALQTDGDEAQPLDRDAQIASTLQTIAGGIASGRGSLPVDIVFLLDASGSMEDNIRAVGRHLINMVDIFQESQLDFTVGVVKFKYSALIFPQTKDYQKYERLLENMECGGDERAYDAIAKSIARVKFRPEARRRFILVTDEPFKGSYTIQEVLKRCREAGVTVDVIGGVINADDPLKAKREQKALASQTGGMWFPIPGT